MSDSFASNASALDSPGYHAAAVTPNDGSDLATFARALYVGTGGNVTLDTAGGETAVAFVGVAAGTIIPVRAARVRSTGTTASDIVALW